MRLGHKAACAVALLLAGYSQDADADSGRDLLAVKTEVVAYAEYTPEVAVTGDIEARYQNDLAFRVTGRVKERLVDVGDHVVKGQILATLLPEEKQADLDASQASVNSIEATLRQAALDLKRQDALLAKGFTTQSNYDSAQERYRVATGNLEAARGRLLEARESLDETILRSEDDGVITARNVEVGQVVQPGAKVFSVARDGPRDAVVRVFAAMFADEPDYQEIRVQLVSNPEIESTASLREIAPSIDAVTGTVKLKLSVNNPSPSMTLGAPVTVIAKLRSQRLVSLPWRALASSGGQPAVWVLDPETSTVRLRPVHIARHETGRILISDGLKDGETVVTLGTQLLSPNQTVAASEEAVR